MWKENIKNYFTLELLGFDSWDDVTLESLINAPTVDAISSHEGMTPLHVLGKSGVLEVLCHQKVHECLDAFGNTPVHWLGEQGVTEILGCMHLTIKNNWGNTPLHYLALSNKEVCHPLMNDLYNGLGQTPYDMRAN